MLKSLVAHHHHHHPPSSPIYVPSILAPPEVVMCSFLFMLGITYEACYCSTVNIGLSQHERPN